MRRRWKNWSRKRRVFMVLTLAFVLLIPVPLGAYAVSLRVRYAGDPAAEARTRNNDALWLGHAWVDGRKTEADVTELARKLEGTGIRDLYVHAGPLEHDGTLALSKVSPRARWFTSAMRAAAPDVRVQAWLGDLVQPGKHPGMDLDDPAVRTGSWRRRPPYSIKAFKASTSTSSRCTQGRPGSSPYWTKRMC